MSQKIEQKIINNAISAYLMVFISWLLLLNKDNEKINNPFVKNHVLSSVIIHILLIVNYVIFIKNSLGYQIWNFFGFSFNLIVANIIFLWLLFLLIIWIYKASKWEKFSIWEFIKTNKKINLEINNNSDYEEKDKVSIILSYIPFLWFIVWSKFDNSDIKNILKVNLFITVIIYLLYLFWYNNLTSLFVLAYTIFVIFVWINLFVRNELITLNLPYYFLPSWKIILQKIFIRYLKNYFGWNFTTFEQTKAKVISEIKQKNSEEIKINTTKKELKLNKNLIYIPFVNLILLKELNSKYHLHIKNWISITILLTLFIILNIFGLISSKLFLVLLFPICFGFWKLNKKIYKMPYIFEAYELFSKTKSSVKKSKKYVEEKHKEEKNVSFKVE